MSLFEPYTFSCSMYHKEKDFDKWWEQNNHWYENFNISKDIFETFPLKNGFSSEDLHLRIMNVPSEDINIGDIGLYKREDNKGLIAHRVIGKEYTDNTSYILLNGVYTQRHNRKHRKDDPLFRGRFKSVLIQDDKKLQKLYNSLKHLCRSR